MVETRTEPPSEFCTFFCQGGRGVVETQHEPPPIVKSEFFAARERKEWWRLKMSPLLVNSELMLSPLLVLNSCAYFLTYLLQTSNPGGGFIKCLNILFCFISTD